MKSVFHYYFGKSLNNFDVSVFKRSLSGEGNFNWRFIFSFDYIKAEDKIVYKIKDSPFAIDETEIKAPCKLYLQVWDADLVTADDFLGGLELILSKIPRGAKSSQTCGLHQLSKDGSVSTISIFKNKRYRGWWPFTGENEDDPKELDVNGKVDAEFNLLSKDEAEACPVGLGREEPNALPSPNRPDSSFLNFMNPLKSLKYLICNKFKWFLIKALIISALLALVVLFIYNAPGYLAKRMLGA